MKKITFLLLIFISTFSFSQVVLDEDFESPGSPGLPTGWTVQDLVAPPNGEIWTIENTGEAGGFTTPNTLVYTPGGASGSYATFDSDGYGNNMTAEESTLTSPAFSCVGLTSVELNFNHYFNGSFGGAGFVEVFDGSSWITVISYPSVPDGSGVSVSGLVSQDVSTELAGVANAQVRFRFTGDWSISWSVDNISVFQCTVSAPDAVTAVITPTDTATNVPINYRSDTNNIGPFEWTAAATGDPATTFNLNLGTDAAASNIGVLEDFPSGNSINFGGFAANTTYFWRIDAVNCAGVTPGPIWSFTTAECNDTAPSVNSESPTNNAMGVAIAGPDGTVTFSWADAGDPATAYRLNLGTTDPPGQAFENFANGGAITGLAVNTQYFWSVDAINCAGETTGTVWNFTTDTTLSIEDDNELVPSFKVYPNPTNGILNIKTTLEIDTVSITNLLGQQVAYYNKSSISDNSVNLSELSQGLYMVTVTAGDKSETFKINKR